MQRAIFTLYWRGENTVSASATGNVYQGCENGLAAIHSTGKINIYDGPGPLPDSSLPTIGSINASVVNTVGDHADGIRAAGDINLNKGEGHRCNDDVRYDESQRQGIL